MTLPVLEERALMALEAEFPAKCKRPSESEGEHQRYAGKVELVEALRLRRREALDDAESDDELGIPDADAERA